MELLSQVANQIAIAVENVCFNLIDSAVPLVVPLSLELPVASSPAGIVWQTQQSLVLKDLGAEDRRSDTKSQFAVPHTSAVRTVTV